MRVQRFSLRSRSEVYEDVNGDYVFHDDYERDIAILQARVAELEQQIEDMDLQAAADGARDDYYRDMEG